MDDAQVEAEASHVHVLVHRIAVGLGDLVAGVEVGPGLHLDHRVAALVVELEVVAVLKKGAAHSHRALVVERRSEDQVGLDVVGGEVVVEPVGVAGVLVVDHVRDHDVADVGVQRSRFAHEVNAGHPGHLLGRLPEHVVGGEAERIVDVEDGGVGGLQCQRVDLADAGIETSGVELGEFEDLSRGVDPFAARRQVADPLRLLVLRSFASQPL